MARVSRCIALVLALLTGVSFVVNLDAIRRRRHHRIGRRRVPHRRHRHYHRRRPYYSRWRYAHYPRWWWRRGAYRGRPWWDPWRSYGPSYWWWDYRDDPAWAWLSGYPLFWGAGYGPLIREGRWEDVNRRLQERIERLERRLEEEELNRKEIRRLRKKLAQFRRHRTYAQEQLSD